MKVRYWLLILAFWTLLGLFFVSETYLAFALNRNPITWQNAVLFELPGWYIWAALAPLVVYLAQRVRFEHPRVAFAILFHATASGLFSVLQLTLKIGVRSALAPSQAAPFRESLRFLLETGAHLNLLTYWAILGGAYAFEYYRRAKERELDAAQLQAQLAQAQLQVLERELRPHFLFNTLNTVSALIEHEPRTAERILARLGELLRLTLERTGRQEVPLSEELEFLNRYVEIETTRFRDRLAVTMDVEPAALQARIPSLVLQPLVENAIRHGISKRAGAGRIELHAHVWADRLTVSVRDNGPGLNPRNSRDGIGLSNTRSRLRQLYGEHQALLLENGADGGTTVTMEIPFRLAAAHV